LWLKWGERANPLCWTPTPTAVSATPARIQGAARTRMRYQTAVSSAIKASMAKPACRATNMKSSRVLTA